MQEFSWIPAEKKDFGAPGSQYDWSAANPKDKIQEMEAAQNTVQQLEAHVNKGVSMDLKLGVYR